MYFEDVQVGDVVLGYTPGFHVVVRKGGPGVSEQVRTRCILTQDGNIPKDTAREFSCHCAYLKLVREDIVEQNFKAALDKALRIRNTLIAALHERSANGDSSK